MSDDAHQTTTANQAKSTMPLEYRVILTNPYIPATGRGLLHDPLFCAAQLRAIGCDWQRAAAELKMSHDDLRGLSLDYPDQWNKFFRDAEREFYGDIGREASNRCRKHMRSEDEKISLNASKTILSHMASVLRHTPAEKRDFSEGSPFSFFSGWSDEQLKRFCEQNERR